MDQFLAQTIPDLDFPPAMEAGTTIIIRCDLVSGYQTNAHHMKFHDFLSLPHSTHIAQLDDNANADVIQISLNEAKFYRYIFVSQSLNRIFYLAQNATEQFDDCTQHVIENS